MKLKRILMAVDFSECSTAAFKYAKSLAKKFSASVQAIHVVDRSHVEIVAEVYGKPENSVTKEFCLQAKERFKGFLAENNPEGMDVAHRVAVGIPFQTIALKAQEWAMDMIVIGGHGTMGSGHIDKIFFGSEAERVVRMLPCPVLCVPSEIAGT